MQLHKKFLRLVFSMTVLTSSAFCSLPDSFDGYMGQNVPSKEAAIQKGLFRGKHGRRGHRGHRGHHGHKGPRGHTGPQGAKGDPGKDVSQQIPVIYSSHYGTSGPYVVSFASQPLTFFPSETAIDYDVGGTSYDFGKCQVTVPEDGLYELHVDLSLTSTDSNLFAPNASCLLNFLINGYGGGGSVLLSKNVQYIYSQQINNATPSSSPSPYPSSTNWLPLRTTLGGSLTTTLSLSAGDSVAVAIFPGSIDNPSASYTTDQGGYVNFTVREIVSGDVASDAAPLL